MNLHVPAQKFNASGSVRTCFLFFFCPIWGYIADGCATFL
uniref:Uncharacterized protein n=1 Tax=Arundo donax TaxID=35708 RepID=A0A0A9EVV9_ARUDO